MPLPLFPNFKKIELSDKDLIESFTRCFQSYSDFNFINLWVWDVRCERQVSQLHGNLVLFLTDYITGEKFLSFIGVHDVKKTSMKLIEFAKDSGISPVLRLITEETAKSLIGSDLTIERDDTHSDYLFSVSQLAKLEGSKFKKKRQLSQRFLRENPDSMFVICEMADEQVQEQLKEIIRKWEINKIRANKTFDLKSEESAINRLLNTANEHTLILSCLYVRNQMVGFSIDEIQPDGFALSHFVKADTSFRGVYEFLNEKVAKYLATKDVKIWNWEQNLNIPGLKMLKDSYQPVGFLNKYLVSYNLTV